MVELRFKRTSTNFTLYTMESQNEDNLITGNSKPVHIKIRNRGRKQITSVIGLSEVYDLKKIMGYYRKKMGCIGSIKDHDVYGRILVLSGDQRQDISEFLYNQGIADKEEITVHGG
ncbi:hypothetical protein PCE1_004677 [Barthelona sp. PCE]